MLKKFQLTRFLLERELLGGEFIEPLCAGFNVEHTKESLYSRNRTPGLEEAQPLGVFTKGSPSARRVQVSKKGGKNVISKTRKRKPTGRCKVRRSGVQDLSEKGFITPTRGHKPAQL
jgi:hypothetical protein